MKSSKTFSICILHERFSSFAISCNLSIVICSNLNVKRGLFELNDPPKMVHRSTKEKCTDINIATGLLTKAFHNSYDVALLFSGDRDYKKVVRELRRMGKIVGIVTPDGDAKDNASDLANNVDFHIVLNESFYKQFWIPQNGQPYQSMISKPKVK